MGWTRNPHCSKSVGGVVPGHRESHSTACWLLRKQGSTYFCRFSCPQCCALKGQSERLVLERSGRWRWVPGPPFLPVQGAWCARGRASPTCGCFLPAALPWSWLLVSTALWSHCHKAARRHPEQAGIRFRASHHRRPRTSKPDTQGRRLGWSQAGVQHGSCQGDGGPRTFCTFSKDLRADS